MNDKFNIGLPKWPQCIIKGEKISEEQALEIIRRTDSFFCGFSSSKYDFNKQAYKICKRPDRFHDINMTENEINDIDLYLDSIKEWENKWGLIDTCYIKNDWVSSSYIEGVNGWCHPDGTIEYHHNVGKYPNVKNVYDDLAIIGKEFPFLNLTLTLMNQEECDNDISEPLVSMKLANGEVSIINTLSKEELHYEKTTNNSKRMISLGRSHETYFSLEQIQNWTDQIFTKEK